MGRMAGGGCRGDTSNVNKAALPAASFECTACRKSLPRSAFAKADLNRGGSGRCRDCGQRACCKKCQVWLLPAQLDAKSTCQRCRENAQVDRLLQTPKDEVTHFGVESALRLDREAEHEMLMVCQKCGICERLVLQRILDFIRVPFVTTQNGMHFCELCDTTFGEVRVKRGQVVHIAVAPDRIDWTGSPGSRLAVNVEDSHTVAELRKVSNDRWFFRTLATPPNTAVREASSGSQTKPRHLAADVMADVLADGYPKPSPGTAFESFWAPLDSTVEGRELSPIAEHLNGKVHKDYETVVAEGSQLLVSRAALKLAKRLGEDPSMSLGRFRAGLGIVGRFCAAPDVEHAERLQRVRDVNIPVKFLREVLPTRTDFLWITSGELWEAEEKYEQRRKRGSKKG